MLRRTISLLVALTLAFALVLPAVAIESENGYRDCGIAIAALRAQYWGGLAHTPPGGSTANFVYFGAGWAVKTRNGSYAGNWVASADDLHFGGTYSFCQPYG